MNKDIYGYGTETISVPEYKQVRSEDGDATEFTTTAKIYQRVIIGVRVGMPPASIISATQQQYEARHQAIAAITNSKDYDWLMEHNWDGHIPMFRYREDPVNDVLIGSMDFYIDERDYIVHLLGR